MPEFPNPRCADCADGSLLRVRDLAFAYPHGPTVLQDINLQITPGERIALVGQNGSGKTTLMKLFSGLLRPGTGQINYKGEPLAGMHLESSRLQIGLLFQDPDDQLFGHTLIDDTAFGPRQQGLPPQLALQAARQALQQVYLDDLAYKPPHLLSYGQKKRAALAGLLAMQPEMLLLDEPTANLDPRQEQVFLDLLKSYTGTLICISQDLLFLYDLCQRAVVLEQGSLVRDCRMDELVSQRSGLRTFGLDFSFRLIIPPAAEQIHGFEPVGQSAETAFQLPGCNPPTPLIELNDYSFRYPDGTPALNRIQFRLNTHQRVALVGENGAGKSTLLACLLGLQRGEGKYLFEGTAVTLRRCRLLWRRVGMVFQDSADQLFCPSVREEIAFGLKQIGLSKQQIAARVQQALTQVHMEGFEDRVPLHMSGGERKRLALASVLSMAPDLLIFDEPTAGLDPPGEQLLLSILQGLDITLLLVSHDMFFVGALTQRTLVIHQGQIIEDLSTADFIRDPRLGSHNGLSYAFRRQGSEAIRALQHEHEHNHPHRHLHSHLHRHGDIEHSHLHEHAHAHRHRFAHSHPGEGRSHEHFPRQYHDHTHPDHDKDPDHHP